MAALDVWDRVSELGREDRSEDIAEIEIAGVDDPAVESALERIGEWLFGDLSTELHGVDDRLGRYGWSSSQV